MKKFDEIASNSVPGSPYLVTMDGKVGEALYNYYKTASIVLGWPDVVTPQMWEALDDAGLQVRKLIGVPEGVA